MTTTEQLEPIATKIVEKLGSMEPRPKSPTELGITIFNSISKEDFTALSAYAAENGDGATNDWLTKVLQRVGYDAEMANVLAKGE